MFDLRDHVHTTVLCDHSGVCNHLLLTYSSYFPKSVEMQRQGES